MTEENRQDRNYKLPISKLAFWGILAGVGLYFYTWKVWDNAGIGIVFGFGVWQLFLFLGIRLTTNRVIRKTEEMSLKDPEEALEFLRYACSVLKNNLRLREYLFLRENNENGNGGGTPAIVEENMAESAVAVEIISETSPNKEEEFVEELPAIGFDETHRIDRALVVMMCLLPWVFIPFFRQTVPCLGLWPAVLVGLLSCLSLRKADNPWKAKIAKLGLGLSIASFIVFGLTLPANLLPGQAPKLNFNLIDHDTSWPIKIVQFLVLSISIILHECAHGVSALMSGDPTAERHGRISLNPLRHIDLFGTIILPGMMMFIPGGVMFGWAKPVPVNPANFRSTRKGQLATSFAGIGVNLFLAITCSSFLMMLGVLLHWLYPGMTTLGLITPWKEVIIDGIPAAFFWKMIIEILKAGIYINMILFSLNALPIPPLDGFGILEGFMPKPIQGLMDKIRPVGSFLFLGLIIFKIVDYLLLPGKLIGMLLNFGAGYIAKLG